MCVEAWTLVIRRYKLAPTRHCTNSTGFTDMMTDTDYGETTSALALSGGRDTGKSEFDDEDKTVILSIVLSLRLSTTAAMIG